MKPKVAFFDFASCEGCQLQIANLEEDVLKLLDIVEVVSFREIMKEHSDDYDIAFIEGSITRPMDQERLQDIRKRAKVLVAIGACACTGGINALRNRFSTDDVRNTVYANADIKGNPYFDSFEAKAVDEFVKVDHYIRGCPIEARELQEVVTALVMGRKPNIPNYPVCVECKMKENVCVFEKGGFCLGPVTRAGCGAACPSFGDGCEGCRGLLDQPNTESAIEVLERYGLSVDDAVGRFRLFNQNAGVRK